MIDATILLLAYYSDREDCNRPVVKDIIAKYSGVYLPFDTYLYQPLKETFSRVIIYDYLRRAAEIGHRAMNREIMATVRREHPQYVLWTSYYYDVFPETLDTIRQAGSTVVGWYFDDEWRFDQYSKYWIPHLDYSVTNSVSTVPKYQALNARVIQTIPNTGVACFPDWSHMAEKYDVSFVGSRVYANREQLFDNIEKSGIHIAIFGAGWPRGYVSFEEMLDIFQTSKINLNFSTGNPVDGDVLQIKGRVFQVCMAGGFLLTEYVPGLEKYFVPDKEIVWFHTLEEMSEKIIYYLNHDEERRSIAKAGWARASREYTSGAMMAQVFAEIEKDNRQTPKIAVKKLSPSRQARGILTAYQLDWAAAFRRSGKKDLHKETILRVLPRHLLDIPAMWLGTYFIRFFPLPVQNILRKIYRILHHSTKDR